MNIAVLISNPIQRGGGFQQELSTALLLNANRSTDYNFIYYTTENNNVDILKHYGISCKYIKNTFLDKFCNRLRRNPTLYNLIFRQSRFRYGSFEKALQTNGIDIIYLLSPLYVALDVVSLNYIITVWDLCHRDQLEFPEANTNREFEQRDDFYRKALPKAVAILADSNTGKKNLVRRYCLDDDRVFVTPFLPAQSVCVTEEGYANNYIDIKVKYSIPEDYVFYPAQFWPHKNHVYVLEAIKCLKECHNITINAVFSGSNKGNLKFVTQKAEELGVKEQMFYVGFVDNKELPYLYRQSIALVMATYFGPTNIPPLEAFSLGCPVCYPDTPVLREQVGDAAFLFDLRKPSTLADQIKQILAKSDLVTSKQNKGYEIIRQRTSNDCWKVISEILGNYSYKMKCWK